MNRSLDNGIVNGLGICPLCKKDFKSDDCPHSLGQVQDHYFELRIRKIVREELKRLGK